MPLLDIPDNWTDIRPLLRSILRPAVYGSLLKPGDVVPWRQISTSLLHELVAVDTPEARAIVTVKNTEEWGVTWADVVGAGRENVAQLNPISANEPGTDGAFLDGSQSLYLTSAILTPGWLASFQQPDGPRPVAFVPNEDTLIIGYDDMEEGPKYFEMAEQMYSASDKHVSAEGFTVCGGLVRPSIKPGRTR
jgi:hypothetical protein